VGVDASEPGRDAGLVAEGARGPEVAHRSRQLVPERQPLGVPFTEALGRLQQVLAVIVAISAAAGCSQDEAGRQRSQELQLGSGRVLI